MACYEFFDSRYKEGKYLVRVFKIDRVAVDGMCYAPKSIEVDGEGETFPRRHDWVCEYVECRRSWQMDGMWVMHAYYVHKETP